MKKTFPKYVYNPITLIGAATASLSFGLIIFLFVLDFFSNEENTYLGILTYIIIPSILIFGLLVIAYGVIRERKRERQGKVREQRLPVIDLNDPKKRAMFVTFSVGTIVLMMFSAFGSFKAYEYTETDEFCGTVCHSVMEPEYTAYLDSPHSRVGCVGCHIGSGTSWYVKSKFSGAYQVYSVLFNKYSRPIETPVKSLRPAVGTCEQCHTPSLFYNEKKVDYNYYLSDEQNTKSNISMLIKIGGGKSELGSIQGIHWHINPNNTISYIHSDDRRLVIPWVKVTSKDGKETIFRDRKSKFDERNFNKENLRTMDCIDCHNRPSHIYHQPDKMINEALSKNTVYETIPYIKSISVEVLEEKYVTKQQALENIEQRINNFYLTNYPAIYKSKKDVIQSSIEIVKKIYSRNYFPYMNADWKHFPDNISHVYTPGCFRCHDGNHISDDGKIISNDCNSCHKIISQTDNSGKTRVDLNGLSFKHPVDLEEAEQQQLCTDCHWKTD
ncbi:MAG: NapC/NirT family cytochrome c [Ignavibacteriaceae bacterium]|jgi:nitrate/TMAO reductase-like tetraheme cytochrome c subunit|nr:NapC/NirT family cytochrome c [Ignavibacterium sp.]MCC6255952.1 NapC/NirT family cytochrome c [Ignavibacteriaceae bacterium]HRN26823.1 NapC/NirT family cytochrome c [Ignavibacteriaceae bacterium]HRP93104.1 NapC/NirT family cytochrome c [Ignavibacteriaceae bacterium]HRQ54420.1 NapC/NirT family cytochrome c [Ignavibacteriaceae bacterium]